MKASIELELKTREVYQLFKRRINGNRLFIPAILHKFNKVMSLCRKNDADGLIAYQRIKHKLYEGTQLLIGEITRFESLLEKINLCDSKITYITQLKQPLIVNNPLSIDLVRFIEAYDKLMAVLKLLRLASCFETDQIYFGNTQRYQRITNQILSDFVLMSKSGLDSDNFRTKLSTGIVDNDNFQKI